MVMILMIKIISSLYSYISVLEDLLKSEMVEQRLLEVSSHPTGRTQ